MASKIISLKQFIKDISERNTNYKFPEQAINQAESLKSLSSDLYTDNIRFIYELIQNADDAEAKKIILTIQDSNYFIITHDGKAFDEKDLQGICGINQGTKKKDPDKTGYKGLGFKAVFGKSNKVIIYSKGEYFRFDSSHPIEWDKEWGSNDQKTWEKENDREFIYPWQINPIWTNEDEIPSLVRMFLKQKKGQIHVAYIILLNNIGDIHSALDQLKQQPEMFLFLRNISHMSFSNELYDYTISIPRNLSHALREVKVNNDIKSRWIIKRLELNIPDDIRKKLSNDTKAPEKLRLMKKAEMFFAAKYENPEYDKNNELIAGGIERLREQDSVLLSYLPTKISEYKFPVLINANFLTNVNREQIHTDSIWNQWLFVQISNEIFKWIQQLVKDKKYYSQAYRLIPSILNPENNILTKGFNDTFKKNLQDCHFIRNRQNQLLKVNEVIMDLTSISKQKSFINIDSMCKYMIINQATNSEYASDPFIDYDINLERIGVPKFTWDECIEMFESDIFLQTHSIEANKRMIEYFHTKCPTNIDIQKIPFLLDQRNHLQLTKNIYFPTDTIGDNGSTDAEYLFINKNIVTWLNEKPQRHIKRWLKEIGVDERTDLTYLKKTIIPHVTSYITNDNAIRTINMLFLLFQKDAITKKELEQLKKLKLKTINGTLVPAEQCFLCDAYKPRLYLEGYLKTEMDKFLSFEYVKSHNDKIEDEELAEWRRFFTNLGVQEDLHLLVFDRKLTSFEAAGYGFSEKYLSTTSPDDRHGVDAFYGLTTISLLDYTAENYDFAKFFWTNVIKNIKPEQLTQKIRVYWGHTNKRGAIEGTLLDDADYINWFLNNIECIPTTANTCELSSNVFIDTKELKDLCGKYMSFSSISLPHEKTLWNEIFNFKTKLTVDDYFDLLEKIRNDENSLKDNLNRIQNIYSHLLKEMYFWSSDEKEIAKKRAKSCYLLSESSQWMLSRNLYFYMENNGTNSHLNDAIPCLKLEGRYGNHPHLSQLLDLFHIKPIRMNDLKLADKKSSPAEDFRRKLIEISPFLKKWLKKLSFSSADLSSIDRKLQQEIDFIESESLELFYNGKFVQKAHVYFDFRTKQLYVTRPWNSEITFIDLPTKLCQLLNIHGFESKLRLLLKGTIDEITKYFANSSIPIPTKQDIVILDPLSSSRNAVESVLLEPKKSTPAQSNETVTNKPETTPTKSITTLITDTNSEANKTTMPINPPRPHQIIPQQSQIPFNGLNLLQMAMNPAPVYHYEQISRPSFGVLDREFFANVELIDLSAITSSNSFLFENLSNGTVEFDCTDLTIGRIGEELVYKFLLNAYSNYSGSVNIKWLNEHRESQLPYDILLRLNGNMFYIEVKSTRISNQHLFPISIHQIETFLQLKDNYFIYRVYIDDNKILILDNIRWRLMQQHLACFLRIQPNSSYQTLPTNR